MRTLRASLAVLALACSGTPDQSAPPSQSPAEVMEELLAADRGYAAKAANLSVVEAVGQLLAPDAFMPAVGVLRVGRDSALAQLNSVADNLTSRLEWAPIGGGLSADGQQGYTFGFMTLVRPDTSRVYLKYLAYWVKGADGWKAAAYKRAPRGPGTVPDGMRPLQLPSALVAVNPNEAEVAALADEVSATEAAFSTLAGEVGLGPAFERNAAPESMNIGGPADVDFVYGPAAIGAAVGAGETGPSKLTWGSDHVVVASSGDLGVSIGHINIPDASGGPVRRVPFFTVWRKIDGVWKFVAE